MGTWESFTWFQHVEHTPFAKFLFKYTAWLEGNKCEWRFEMPVIVTSYLDKMIDPEDTGKHL